jgi:HopA1 effector protein family
VTTSSHRAQVAAVLRDVRVVDESTVALRGRPYPCSELLGRSASEHQRLDDAPVTALANLIYSELYTRRRPMAATRGSPTFVDELSATNRSTKGWDAGWKVMAVQGETFTVEKGGLRVYARGHELSAASPSPGEPVQVRLGKEQTALCPGFYLALGDTLEDEGPSAETTVRLYFNLEPRGGVAFVESVTSLLNAACIPFRAKVASSPGAFGRADAGVLYLGRQRYLEALPVLAALHKQLRAHLRRATPLFTKVVAAGTAVAEDPGNGLSFGQHRCRALAVAVYRAHTTRSPNWTQRMLLARTTLEEHGVDAARPYLKLGNDDVYDAWS